MVSFQSADNTADAGTKGLSAKALIESCWLKGPSFLRTFEWPIKPCENFRSKLKQAKLDLSDEIVTESSTFLSSHQTAFSKTFEWQKYCSYEKLLRIAAYMLRPLSKSSLYTTSTAAITDAAELEIAEQHLFFIVQTESFLKAKRNLLKFSPLGSKSKIAQFSPIIGSNNLVRAFGRTKQLQIATFDVKHPIILDARTSFDQTTVGTLAHSTLSSGC